MAISASMVAELQSYCYRARIGEAELIFPVSRSQAFRVVTEAFNKAGIPRPSKEREHVGGVHILRDIAALLSAYGLQAILELHKASYGINQP